MHKFTIFTIIFSIMVVLVIADLVINDYWGKDFADGSQLETSEEAPVDLVIKKEETDEDSEEEDALGEEAFDDASVMNELSEGAEGTEDGDGVEIPEEFRGIDDGEVTVEEPSITLDLLLASNFQEPRLEEKAYEELIFGFWDMGDALAEFDVYENALFEGTAYVGMLYEIQTQSEVDGFVAYEALRDTGETSDTGEVNETNNYGDASFYFNHNTKTNTVFLVFQKGTMVYAFEYSPSYHSQMKALIEGL